METLVRCKECGGYLEIASVCNDPLNNIHIKVLHCSKCTEEREIKIKAKENADTIDYLTNKLREIGNAAKKALEEDA